MHIRIAPLAFAFALAFVSAFGSAHAALEGRDLNGSIGSFEAYYDTDLNITWLADLNYAQTSGYAGDGSMNWFTATAWAASLSFTNGTKVFDNWRLPITVQPDPSCELHDVNLSYGYNCTGGEMGHLFYDELGGVAGVSIATTHNANYGLFKNGQSGYYWTGTEFAPDPEGAWTFLAEFGVQSLNGNINSSFAMAVSPGDVAAVPEAGTWAMLLTGLTLVRATTRRRRG